MSISSCFVMMYLLCLFLLSTTSSATRHLTGVVFDEEPPHQSTVQDVMKNVDKKVIKVETTINMNSSQVNTTKLSDEPRMKLIKTEGEMKPKKKNEDRDHKLKHAMNLKNGRQNHRERRPYPKNLVKSKFPKIVSWSVPRTENDELPQTAINLDYAPPKVHPPTHN